MQLCLAYLLLKVAEMIQQISIGVLSMAVSTEAKIEMSVDMTRLWPYKQISKKNLIVKRVKMNNVS